MSSHSKDAGGGHCRWYEGEWDNNQPHGRGTYSDEFGVALVDVELRNGQLKGERRPPPKGLRERMGKMLGSSQVTFERIEVEPSPCRSWPHGAGMFPSRGALPEKDPPELIMVDEGAGHSHGRTRGAHLGVDGVPGSRWV